MTWVKRITIYPWEAKYWLIAGLEIMVFKMSVFHGQKTIMEHHPQHIMKVLTTFSSILQNLH